MASPRATATFRASSSTSQQGSSNPGTDLSYQQSPNCCSPTPLDNSVRPDYNCSPAEVDDVAGDARVNDNRSQRSLQRIVDGRAGEEMTESADVDAGNEGLCANTVNGEDDFMKLFSSERLPNCDLSVADAMVTLMAYSTLAGLNWSDMEKLVHVVNLLLGAECVINELPVAMRWSNVLLGGLWFGKGHPKMAKFLDVFVKEVLEMSTVKWRVDERELQSSVKVVCCCGDAPARAGVLNAKQFNGYFGCSFCLHKGARCKSAEYDRNVDAMLKQLSPQACQLINLRH
ncbi:hypothetical protein HPB49_020827 [Dermacentor silvarum]|uniref:Uncharacterized protein n=1 Tax=Dermacentor silvarum TaxID=543639 RepID=A0ACB8DL35_DERSI|nr:hypothetical protein HPB49_020827 [Dermacentor silvarum]